jgi:hypothetical protein
LSGLLEHIFSRAFASTRGIPQVVSDLGDSIGEGPADDILSSARLGNEDLVGALGTNQSPIFLLTWKVKKFANRY